MGNPSLPSLGPGKYRDNPLFAPSHTVPSASEKIAFTTSPASPLVSVRRSNRPDNSGPGSGKNRPTPPSVENQTVPSGAWWMILRLG